MTKTTKTLFTLALVFTFGCSNQVKETGLADISYFDIETLLDEQLKVLVDGEAKLEKILSTGDEQESMTIDLDSAGWHEQLSLFYDAGINKPGFIGEYFEERLPPINGISKTIYSAKSLKSAVQVMECFYEGEDLAKIRLLVKETNTIYSVTKEMYLYFDEKGITSFDITGEESMRMKADLNYKIQGTVVRKS